METVVVVGYPGSGKSEWVESVRHEGDLVFDMDAICAMVEGRKIHERGNLLAVVRAATMMRETLCDQVDGLDGTLYLIRTTADEWGPRAAAGKARIVRLEAERDECRERIQERGDWDEENFGIVCDRVDRFLATWGELVDVVA